MTCSKLSFPKYVGVMCLSIPVMTALVERSFSQMKLFKTHLRYTLNDKNLPNLRKIALESPVELIDSHLEEIIDVWNRKSNSLGELEIM